MPALRASTWSPIFSPNISTRSDPKHSSFASLKHRSRTNVYHRILFTSQDTQQVFPVTVEPTPMPTAPMLLLFENIIQYVTPNISESRFPFHRYRDACNDRKHIQPKFLHPFYRNLYVAAFRRDRANVGKPRGREKRGASSQKRHLTTRTDVNCTYICQRWVGNRKVLHLEDRGQVTVSRVRCLSPSHHAPMRYASNPQL